MFLSPRGNWPQSPSAAANSWTNFWQAEIRYLVAYQEVTGIPLTEASTKERSTQSADAIERDLALPIGR